MGKYGVIIDKLTYSFQAPIYIISVAWLIEMLQFLLPFLYGIDNFGIVPRTAVGLSGAVLAPFLHGSFSHLMGNTFPFVALLATMLYFYPKNAWRAFFFIYVVTNLAVWLFAHSANHIGASGLVFGFSTYLFFGGFFRRDVISLLISATVLFFYGTMWYGILPTDPRMSWESHLAGAVVGALASRLFSQAGPKNENSFLDEE